MGNKKLKLIFNNIFMFVFILIKFENKQILAIEYFFHCIRKHFHLFPCLCFPSLYNLANLVRFRIKKLQLVIISS